ncbi:hypothetical protein [Streptomyces scopuliridis]|uniref:hypothetical protein n=1 Tax=Streptomyces scopuliridis TaxID=452529 RepID=UPI0036832158
MTVLVVAGLLLAGAAAGLAATGLGTLARRVWVIRGGWRPARWLVGWRQRRWRRADEKACSLVRESIRMAARAPGSPAGNDVPSEPQVLVSGPAIAEALARREAIGLESPDRSTWIGDRWRATMFRIHRAYGLDMTVHRNLRSHIRNSLHPRTRVCRCSMLRPDPAQRHRLVEIRDNLIARITEAEQEGWLGEIEGLRISLASAEEELIQLDAEQVRQHQVIDLGMPRFNQIVTRTSTATGPSS